MKMSGAAFIVVSCTAVFDLWKAQCTVGDCVWDNFRERLRKSSGKDALVGLMERLQVLDTTDLVMVVYFRPASLFANTRIFAVGFAGMSTATLHLTAEYRVRYQLP